MRINQEQIIEEVSNETCISNRVVKEVLRGLGKVISKKLTESPYKKMVIDLWEGFKIKRYYQEEKDYSKGVVKDVKCSERVVIKPTVTRTFKEKLNKQIFEN